MLRQMSLTDAEGRIDALGKDIVTLAGIGDGEPILLLKDQGSTLDVITLTSQGISASMVAGLNNGKVFAVIDCNPFGPYRVFLLIHKTHC